MSQSFERKAFRRDDRYTRFSSALPRVRQRRPGQGRGRSDRDNSNNDNNNNAEIPRVLFEPLEQRFLLSADISPLVVAMADLGHELTVRLDSAADALQIINDQTGTVVGQQQASRTSQVQIIGTGGGDRLTLDLSAGYALPIGIEFDAGGGHNQLDLRGSVDEVMHQLTGGGAGQISLLEGGKAAGPITYTGLDQITDQLSALSRSIAMQGPGNNATLSDAGNNTTQLTTSQGEVLGFGADTQFLGVDAEASSLTSLASLRSAHVALHGNTLSVGGAIDAHGNFGGTVDLTGNVVDLLNGAIIDATGLAGGGAVHVGGDLHGAGALLDALTTRVEQGAVIDVSATGTGQGGQAVVWADGSTWFAGTILGRGGALGGGGGSAEVSGKGALGFGGYVDLSAAQGTDGTLLLDPTNVDIVHTASSANDGSLPTIAAGDGGTVNYTISDSALEAVAATTNISIVATNNITIDDLAGNTLNFATTAGNSVTFNAGGEFAFQNAADKIVTAGGDLSITAATIGTLGSFNLGSGALTLAATASGITLNNITAGTLNVTASGGINETSGAIVDVSGTATLNAAHNNVDLTAAASNVFTTLNITAGKVSLNADNLSYTSLNLTGVTDVAVLASANMTLTDTTLIIGACLQST